VKHILGTSSLLLLCISGPGQAQPSIGKEEVRAFLEAVGCTRLPMGACELLDAQNAQNILDTYKATLSERFCGTRNLNAARIMLETEQATNLTECARFIRVAGVSQPRQPSETAPARTSPKY
jgi:hypothetical protein